MITQDRNGNALPSTVDPARLQWSARIAATGGDYLTPANWTYYELPPAAILQRSRSSVLDGSTWTCSLTVLAEAVPELTDLQAYYQLEVDLVDEVGNAWPYHTGPIDSISDAYEEVQGAIVQTKEITSFGTLQRLKNARVNGFFWDGNSQAVSGSTLLTGFAEAVNVEVTTTGATGTFTVPGSYYTVDATVGTGSYPGIIVSPNADFSSPYTYTTNYTVTATLGSPLALVFVTAPATTIYVKYWALRYFGLRRRAITYSGHTVPAFVRIPDGTMPAGSTQTAPRRRLSDNMLTLASAGCTTTSITVQDPEPYKDQWGTDIISPASGPVDILCHTLSDGSEVFRPIASTNASGVITLSAALPAAPAEGDPIRIVTTEIEREFITSGADQTYFTLGTELAMRDTLFFDARQGIVLPVRGRHFSAAGGGLLIDFARYIPTTKGTLGSTDSSIESFVYRTFTDFPATDVTKFFRSADFVAGSFSGSFVKAYSAANTTWDAVLREVTDLAAAPNVFVHDLPDGRLKAGAYYQASVPDATLDLLTGVDVEAQPEPMTAVQIKSISRDPVNITGLCRTDVYTFDLIGLGNPFLTGAQYVFDGRTDSYADLSDTSGTVLGDVYVAMAMQLPQGFNSSFPYIDRVMVYPGATLGAIFVRVKRTTAAGVSTTFAVNGFGYIMQTTDPVIIPGAAIEEAIYRLGLDEASRYTVEVVGTITLDDAGAEVNFTCSEVEIYGNVQAVWTARLNDNTTSAPTGYATTNQQGFGRIWWQRDVTRPVSERYASTAYLKRVMPQYDSAGTYRLDRLQVVEMEQATATEVRRYAETFMDEYVRLGRTYRVQAVMDPRIDLGDTVAIQLDDGQTLDLFVWSIADQGGAQDLTASYTLIDYSG